MFDCGENETNNPEGATLKEFDTICRALFDERAKLDELEAAAKNQSGKVEALKAKIIAHMEAAGLEKFAVAGLGTVFTTDRFTVTVPKDGEARDAFFGYLKSRGIFEELITVNSQTLNAFYKRCLDEAVEKGNPDFKVPGIGEPKHVRTLGMRKA